MKEKKPLNVKRLVYWAWGAIILGSFLAFGRNFSLILVALTGVSYVQNMAFTWVSRSRNGGDSEYHRYASWASNGVWMITQVFIAANVYTPITTMVHDQTFDFGSIMKIFLTFLVYSLSTAEGSVEMMKINLGQYKLPKFLHFLVESGKKQVGSR